MNQAHWGKFHPKRDTSENHKAKLCAGANVWPSQRLSAWFLLWQRPVPGLGSAREAKRMTISSHSKDQSSSQLKVDELYPLSQSHRTRAHDSGLLTLAQCSLPSTFDGCRLLVRRQGPLDSPAPVLAIIAPA